MTNSDILSIIKLGLMPFFWQNLPYLVIGFSASAGSVAASVAVLTSSPAFILGWLPLEERELLMFCFYVKSLFDPFHGRKYLRGELLFHLFSLVLQSSQFLSTKKLEKHKLIIFALFLCFYAFLCAFMCFLAFYDFMKALFAFEFLFFISKFASKKEKPLERKFSSLKFFFLVEIMNFYEFNYF